MGEVAQAMVPPHRMYWGFDSFIGLPEEATDALTQRYVYVALYMVLFFLFHGVKFCSWLNILHIGLPTTIIGL